MVRFLIAVIAIVAVALPAAAGPSAPAVPAQQPGEGQTMMDIARAKLDAFLKQAVDDKRPDLLRVIVRLGEREGAGERVREQMEKLELKVERTMSGGRLVLTTLKAAQLLDLAASEDVAGISFDAIVKPQGPGLQSDTRSS